MDRYRQDIAELAVPLTEPADFDVLLDRVANARVVILGGASHGTHEFYRWRAMLTQRLLDEHGFSFVAAEDDWSGCDQVDRSVRRRGEAPPHHRVALAAFDQWPRWTWANEDMVDFCRWLRARNARMDEQARVGFHGLDVYSLRESMREILLHLRGHDPELLNAALCAFRWFEPHGEIPPMYVPDTAILPTGCEDEVVRRLVDQLHGADRYDAAGRYDADGSEPWHHPEIVAGAEHYYRALAAGGPQAWNTRARHLAENLERLLQQYGPASRAVVWTHNAHAGDARGTAILGGLVSIGQLARDRYGAEQVVLVGFGSYGGGVAAAGAWGEPMEYLPVPPARRGSLEDALHDAAPAQALMVFPPGTRPGLLTDWLDHRGIGTVYHPDREHWNNYLPTRLGNRYDAFCWFDQTRPLRPVRLPRVDSRAPDAVGVAV